MNKFKIITDSGCDLSYEMVKELDLGYIGLICDLEGNRIVEDCGKSVTYKDFYNKLSKGAMPKTSQINPSEFYSEFDKYLSTGYDILYISFSSQLSGTHNSALIARDELLEKYTDSKIIIVDSLSASNGLGLLVYEAAKQKQSGKTIEETAEYVKTIRNKLRCFFTVKDLKHLERGGRIGSAAAMVGSILNISPILEVTQNGILENIGKVRGEKKALKEVVDKIGVNASAVEDIFITHADNDKAVEYVCNLIKEKYNPKNIYVNYIGLAIGSHTGQGALGIFFLGSER